MTIIEAKVRVQEQLRDDPRVVSVGVGKVGDRLGIIVYGTMAALDFERVGDIRVGLRRASVPAPLVPAAARPALPIAGGVALCLAAVGGLVGLGAAASLAARGPVGARNADSPRDPRPTPPLSAPGSRTRASWTRTMVVPASSTTARRVKSAIGNNGAFSARSPKLSANRGSAAKNAKPKTPAWPPPVPKNDADIFASIYRWTSGRCLEFAQALHERYGYPLVVITPAYNRDYAIHVVCAVPGGYVDALGFRTEANLRAFYARELAWDAKNDRKYGYNIPPEQETLLFRPLPLAEIENIMDTEVRPSPQFLEPGTVLMVDEAAVIIAASPDRYGPRGSAAKRAPAKKPAPRYVMLSRGGNGSGITRFLPDEHVLGRKIDWVNPESLEIDPLDTERDPERLKSVLQRMRDGLPLPALIVYEGEQTIWDGHHRQLAALKLKLPLVPVQWLRYEPGDA